MVIECWKPHKYKETLAIYVVSSLFILTGLEIILSILFYRHFWEFSFLM